MADLPVISRERARRIAVRAQLLEAGAHTDVVATVRHLTMLQIEPTAAVAPAADLVLWTRMGAAYDPEFLRVELDESRDLVEVDLRVRPADEVDLLRPEMAQPSPWVEVDEWLAANARFRDDVLALLEAEGPATAAEIPDTAQVPWKSSGWTDGRNVMKLLELLAARGVVAVDGRRGREREWDLAERVLPPIRHEYGLDESRAILAERRLRSLGIARARQLRGMRETRVRDDLGMRIVVDGVPGEWRVDPAALADDAPFAPRAALLSPLDRLAFDRERLADLFDYEYKLEMYTPKAKRRWGYYALPVLVGDRFVGKLDATADHEAGLLRVHAIHEDVEFGAALGEAVRDEIVALAAWLRLAPDLP